jgi:beta-N-acetylhexosaminidase
MDAIRDYAGVGEAAVLAVEAGNDLLCSTEFETQIPAVIDAVKTGRISEKRIDESVLRILRMKLKLGVMK